VPAGQRGGSPSGRNQSLPSGSAGASATGSPGWPTGAVAPATSVSSIGSRSILRVLTRGFGHATRGTEELSDRDGGGPIPLYDSGFLGGQHTGAIARRRVWRKTEPWRYRRLGMRRAATSMSHTASAGTARPIGIPPGLDLEHRADVGRPLGAVMARQAGDVLAINRFRLTRYRTLRPSAGRSTPGP
jgi:hypothetical protein